MDDDIWLRPMVERDQPEDSVGSRPEPRPAWQRSWPQHLRAVAASVGPARLAAGAVGLLIAVTVGWWLLHSPPPPIEDRLPFASGSSAAANGATAGEAPSSGPAASAAATTGTGPCPPSSGRLTVHVAGAVRRPGVYRFGAGARVDDAVERAGGPLAEAVTDAVNLAAVLADGEQVYVPRAGEPAATPGAVGGVAGGVTMPTGPVDLNTASAAQLDVLPGVGPATAAAIVRQRDEAGPYATVDDLLDVPGIGPAKLEALRDLVGV